MSDSEAFRIMPPPPDPNEPPQARLKRMKMRSMRRGIKEMDIILSAFADAELPGMDADELDTYDALLHENDQDLYAWVTGQMAPPARYDALIGRISQTFQNK